MCKQKQKSYKFASKKAKKKKLNRNRYFARTRKLSEDDRMAIGIEMLYCDRKTRAKRAKLLAERYGISTRRCYKIMAEVKPILNKPVLNILPEENGDSGETVSALVLNEDTKKRIILNLSMDGKCSNAAISRFFEETMHISVSPAEVSKVVNDYGKAAFYTNEVLDQKAFPKIKAIGMDEIFQGQQPILTVVDLDTTYVLLIEPEKDRTGETWEIQASIMQEYGLKPEHVISDACGAILVTIPKKFGEEAGQLDVFHALKDLCDVLFTLLRNVDSLINEEGKLEDRILNTRTQQRTRDKLAALQKLLPAEVDKADNVEITYRFIVELLGFSGYTVEEVKELVEFFVRQLERVFKDGNCAECKKREQCQKCQNCTRCAGCTKVDGRKCMNCPDNRGCQACHDCARCPHPDECKFRNEGGKALKILSKFLENLPTTLRFLEKFFTKMADLDQELPEKYKGLHAKVYTLWRYKKESSRWLDGYVALVEEYGEPIVDKALAAVTVLTKTTKRASSLVECLNSRIRPIINSKRKVSKRHMELLKLKFNTRVYRRSRVPERVGKSPIELVTGEHHDFYELLGIGEPLIIEVPMPKTA